MNGIPTRLKKDWKNKKLWHHNEERREIKLLQSHKPKFNEDTKT